MTYKCPDCERNRLSAAMWRNEAYKHAGIELPWSPEEMIEEAVKEERVAILQTIEELCGSGDAHPMFADGYDAALDHIKQFIEGRKE